jgi:hypothetical protein
MGGHSNQTSQYINIQRNNTSGPYGQASTSQAEPIVGNEPSSQSRQGSFIHDLSSSSLAMLIARDRAVSTLDALVNHLINK